MCSFDKIFRELLVSTFEGSLTRVSCPSTEELSNDGAGLECDELPASIGLARNSSHEEDLAQDFEEKICLVQAYAFVCLRMSMKFSETQENLFAHIVP